MAGRGVGRDGYDLGPVASRVSRAFNKAAGAVLDGDEATTALPDIARNVLRRCTPSLMRTLFAEAPCAHTCHRGDP